MPNPGASSLLEKALTDAFQSPEYSVGRLIPSERELCERFAVSRTTLRGVLRLLTDQGLLASEAGRGHRLLRRRARAASASAIADFFVAELVNPFYAGLASLMSGIFREKGMELRVHDYAHRYESLPGRILECQKGASPVVVHFPGDREALANFARAGKPPLVLIHPMAPLAGELPFDQVVLDSYGGGRRAMEHLLSVGRRRIAYLGLDGQAPERLRGYIGRAPDGYLNVEARTTQDVKKLQGRVAHWIELDPERAPI
ncbi:MAG: GntR family transcriptional regulator, partial [Spirochaetes bacterium]|nr:GntR family transcriptional regulator [Spirochaetota bacterium]